MSRSCPQTCPRSRTAAEDGQTDNNTRKGVVCCPSVRAAGKVAGHVLSTEEVASRVLVHLRRNGERSYRQIKEALRPRRAVRLGPVLYRLVAEGVIERRTSLEPLGGAPRVRYAEGNPT